MINISAATLAGFNRNKMLNNLLSDDATRERIAQNGQTWVRQHQTWGATTSVYRKIYNRISNSQF